jgi:diguanylate cyclase (GGDEF)-like protein/PAS domain S-box-containing protein
MSSIQPTIKSASPYRAALREFVLIFSLGALLIVAVGVATIWFDHRAQSARVEGHDAMEVELASKLIAHDFETVVSDLRMLSKTPDMLDFLNSRKAADRVRLAEYFRVFAAESGLYDQARFLDANGMEKVRVNYGDHSARIVPDEQLQDKSGRYFFRDTIKLGAGQVYVSPLDLNIEQQRIEMPFKPMIRFGTPVFDRDGKKRGIVLLNYFGSVLLHSFKEVFTGEGRPMLLNRDGYWLSSPEPGDEWGFMLGNQRTLGKDYPEEWRVISATSQGRIRTANGLFTFWTVWPLQPGHSSATGTALPSGASQRALAHDEYYWKIVLHRPSIPVLSAEELASHRAALAIMAGSLLLWAVLAWHLALARAGRKQWRAALAESETRLREISETLAEGVYVVDKTGQIVFANPAAQRELGYTEAELLGQQAHALLHYQKPDGTPCSRQDCEIGRVMVSGQTYRAIDDAFWRKDGSLLPVAVSASPIVRNGKMEGLVVAFHDITGRKQSQERLTQAMADLAQSNRETERINTELMQANAELERISHSDGLTGVANRRHFDIFLDGEWRSAARADQSLSLIMIDIDYFKAYNDHYGHQGGDDCLKSVAGALGAALGRPRDLLARYGGEEFAVVLPDTSPEGALHVAENLHGAVERLHLPHVKSDASKYITVSLGVATMMPDAQASIPAVLIAAADKALYQAKMQGRNRICVADGPETAAAIP